MSPLGIKVFLSEGFNRGESTIVLHHTNLSDCDKGLNIRSAIFSRPVVTNYSKKHLLLLKCGHVTDGLAPSLLSILTSFPIGT